MKLYGSVEEVPPYKWRTPLQRSIQLLKRHRDVMFMENPKVAPISMVITNLATRAYNGEPNLFEAVINILDRMADFVRPSRPRVPNPANPAEDYADKWNTDPDLEQNFWAWQTQAKADFSRLEKMVGADGLATVVA